MTLCTPDVIDPGTNVDYMKSRKNPYLKGSKARIMPWIQYKN
jgi:hypothetical protein